MGKKWSKAARQAQSERMKARFAKGAVVLSDTPKVKAPKYDTVKAFGIDLDQLEVAMQDLQQAIGNIKALLDGK
jgi:hypothetical protein